MEVRFEDDQLRRLEVDEHFTAGFDPAIVRAFRRRMQQIRAAGDERDLRALKSLHFEQLMGRRRGEFSMRVNLQYRLVFTLEGRAPSKVLAVRSIEDYH